MSLRPSAFIAVSALLLHSAPLDPQKITAHALYRLTTVEAFKALCGEPTKTLAQEEGGLPGLTLEYPNGTATFQQAGETPQAPFVLLSATVNGLQTPIGEDRKIKLRHEKDLATIGWFHGFKNVSLQSLDLRQQGDLLKRIPFDTQTEWPEASKLPVGFDPAAIMATNRNPGLGIRALHAKGLKGRGVGIAIIDQPLLLGHEEYVDRIRYYDARGAIPSHPQMHGTVASIAVGKTVGVAPEASLYYFGTAMWEGALPLATALNRAVTLNDTLPDNERIRVISISVGFTQNKPHYAAWKAAVDNAIAKGITVITCDEAFLRYTVAALTIGKDPDQADSYFPGKFGLTANDSYYVPGGSRTVAGYKGEHEYTTWGISGGISWGAPWLAGLVALGCEIDPALHHKKASRLLQETAKPVSFGKMIDPAAFLEAVRKARNTANQTVR